MKLEPQFITIAIFFLIGVGLPIVALSLGRLLRPNSPTKEKSTTYESGVDPTGEGWVQFHARYYLFALLFVLFDVEAVFLYPWAASYDFLRTEMGLFVLLEMAIFIFILLLGLVYAWRKKVLEWK